MQCSRSTRGFTLVELIVTIAIMLVLITILIPALRGSQSARQSVACGTQLRTLGLTTQAYVDDHGGRLPPVIDWHPAGAGGRIVVHVQPPHAALPGLSAYVPRTLLCPADDSPGTMPVLRDGERAWVPISYGLNIDIPMQRTGYRALRHATIKAVFFDGRMDRPGQGSSGIQGSYRDSLEFAERVWRARHELRGNVLFGDWHVDRREELTRSMIEVTR